MSFADVIKDLFRQVTDQAFADGADASDALATFVEEATTMAVHEIESNRAEWLC